MAKKSFNKLYAVGTTESFDNQSTPNNHTLTVDVAGTGTMTACTIALMGSVKSNPTTAELFEIASHVFSAAELTAKRALISVISTPLRSVAMNISVITGLTGISVDSEYDYADE